MSPTVETFSPSSIPSHLFTRLNAHLPYSLTVLRRLQFAFRKKGASTPHSHILYVHDGTHSDDSSPFAAAYLDLSRGPETECWIYSSLQDSVAPNPDPTSSEALLPADLPPATVEACTRQLLALLRRIRAIESDYASGRSEESGEDRANIRLGYSKNHVRIGALHESVRQALIAAGVRVKATSVVPAGQEWEYYATWLIRVEDLKAKNEVDLPEGWTWDALREGDTGLVKSRTHIPKREYVLLFPGDGDRFKWAMADEKYSDTMLMVPSTVIRREDGTAVAWGYLGIDGSVSTLHVEVRVLLARY